MQTLGSYGKYRAYLSQSIPNRVSHVFLSEGTLSDIDC